MPTPAGGQPASRPLAEALLALADTVRAMRTFPDGHPALLAGLAALVRALEAAIGGRDELTVTVGEVQLIADGMETSPEYEPLHDLARDLHAAGVATVRFRPGLSAEELHGALRPVVDRAGGQLVRSSGAHVGVRTRPTGAFPADPWLLLERHLTDDPGRPASTRDAAELALALELHGTDSDWDATALELMATCARAAPSEAGVAGALRSLLEALPAASLRRLFDQRGERATQHRALIEISPLLPPYLLLRLFDVLEPEGSRAPVAGVRQLAARLAEVAATADAPGSTTAGEALRALVFHQADLFPGDPAALRVGADPERLLMLGLEGGILADGVVAAADRMIARRQVAPLLALLDTVPADDPVARALRARVHHPQAVRALLEATPTDMATLERLIPSAGLEAAPALLDRLAESGERRVRLRLLDLLARYGNPVGPLATARLQGMPWYVQRNLLALLGRLPDPPEDFHAEALLEHGDPRVRHEAIALLLADPMALDRGVAEGIESSHEPTLRLALVRLGERCPPELLPRLIARATDPQLTPELRALAVTALAPVPDPVVLRILKHLVLGHGLTGFGRLAPRSPPMLAALRGLALHWGTDPKATSLLEAARQSRENEIRDAARPPARRSGTTGRFGA